MVTACDFCSDRTAVLYCRADSAKLCLLCDHHVHSANALSKKHLRSQICDNCAAAPAVVRCATDNLVLCQDCDFDAHGGCPASSAHDRCPAAEGFSGCPTAFDLASAWGLDIIGEEKKKSEAEEAYQWGCQGLLEELMVPNGNSVIYSNCRGDLVKDVVCGKQKQVIVKQLLELLADGREELRPRTPSIGAAWWSENLFEEQQPQVQEQKQSGGRELTSSLMMQTPANIPKEEGNILWNTNTTCDHTSKIWDFNLGQSRDHEESGTLDLDFGGSDMEYVIKSYGELLKEAAGSRRGIDFQGVSCSFAHEEMMPFNGASNNPTASQGPATSESNNMQASCSGFNRPKSYGCSKDIQFTDESTLIKSESGVAAMTKADLELLAKNRGNAMQRYKEKKKNRRYDKQVRYESRKARADTRKRVKGRFVKASDTREG